MRLVTRGARLTNVVLAGLVAGGDVSSMLAVYPAVDALPDPDRVRVGQAINRGFGRMMQPLVIATIVSGATTLALRVGDRRSPAFRLGAASTACHLAMLALTLRGIAPINVQLLAVGDDYDAYHELRRRWSRLHRVRVALEVSALALAAGSAAAVEDA